MMLRFLILLYGKRKIWPHSTWAGDKGIAPYDFPGAGDNLPTMIIIILMFITKPHLHYYRSIVINFFIELSGSYCHCENLR